jgi:Multidrug resistance efflux pump
MDFVIKAFAAAVVLIVGTSCGSRSEQIRTPERNTKIIQGVGYIEPVCEIRRLSFKRTGVIGKCAVTVGQTVHKGAALMSLDSATEQMELAAAEAELKVARSERDKIMAGTNKFQIRAAESEVAAAESEAKLAGIELKRQERLSSERVGSVSEADRAESEAARRSAGLRRASANLEYLKNVVTVEDRAMAEAKVVLAESHVATARQRLNDCTLPAPIDGTVLELLHFPGERVSEFAPEPVLIFADLGHLRVRAEVDESYVLNVHLGQELTIFGRGLGSRRVSGNVTYIKSLMGKKTVFAHTATERKDLDVLQVFADLPGDFSAPIGLEVDFEIR